MEKYIEDNKAAWEEAFDIVIITIGALCWFDYHSKTLTDYTHPMSEIISGMCSNGIVITNLQEFDYDISGGFTSIDHSGFPLSMILQGKNL